MHTTVILFFHASSSSHIPCTHVLMVIVSKITNIVIENDQGVWRPKCTEIDGTTFIKLHIWEYGFYKLCYGESFQKGSNKKTMSFLKKLIAIRRSTINGMLARLLSGQNGQNGKPKKVTRVRKARKSDEPLIGKVIQMAVPDVNVQSRSAHPTHMRILFGVRNEALWAAHILLWNQ